MFLELSPSLADVFPGRGARALHRDTAAQDRSPVPIFFLTHYECDLKVSLAEDVSLHIIDKY